MAWMCRQESACQHAAPELAKRLQTADTPAHAWASLQRDAGDAVRAQLALPLGRPPTVDLVRLTPRSETNERPAPVVEAAKAPAKATPQPQPQALTAVTMPTTKCIGMPDPVARAAKAPAKAKLPLPSQGRKRPKVGPVAKAAKAPAKPKLPLQPQGRKRPKVGPVAKAAKAPAKTKPQPQGRERSKPAAERPAKRPRLGGGSGLAAAATTPTTKYVGLYWFKRVSKWKATIKHQRKNISLGYFVDEIEAAKAYDAEARRIRGANAHGGIMPNSNSRRCVLNFPTKAEIARKEKLDRQRAEEQRRRNVSRSSRFVGVVWHKKKAKWGASIVDSGSLTWIGYFNENDEEGAARA